MQASDGEAPDLVLASASPRRRELLSQLGLRLQVAPADVDETPSPGERPAEYALRVAGAKCDAAFYGMVLLPTPPMAVLAADTTVAVGAQILGKPADRDDARRMLGLLAGRRHDVITAYRIRCGSRMAERAVTTAVTFRALQPAETDAYLDSGEWEGKAGGYAVQGIAGAFVTELRGSHTNVIGLPLAEVLADLLALGALPGYPPPAFGSGSAR
jgi:septum formation protein